MSLFTAAIDRHGQALELLAQRQRVLGGNIANADTPGYKARDFDFAGALRAAQAGTGGAMRATDPRHLATGGAPAGGTAGPELKYRAAEQPALDGNTVDLDRERAVFADNAVRYEATLRFINSNVRTMLSAITGQ